ncbi:MAG: hypothetical protein EXS64_20760 [Candidatus Latescibacteria bacterium]|nr:hypothetical protein [Candidatus Latescibacterota bacterium]
MADAGSPMLPDHLRRIAEGYYDARERRLGEVRTPEALAARQAEVQGIYRDILGPFPERTPLNIREAGRVAQDGYTIERLIYETQPRLYVTANLYRPEGRGPFPGVICPIGHWYVGKAYKDYQALGAGLARSGCIALVYDPPGQGERLMYHDPVLKGSLLGTNVVDEHTMAGYPCFLTGSHLAMYFIWDGMRSIDLLLGRGDVDPERIGCTGSSGGGTLTRFITSLEDRVKVAIPVCATGNVRVVGAGDAEQNVFTALARGMCPTDLYWAAAPRPLLMITASADRAYEGARGALADVRRAYEVCGVPERVDHVEIEGEHGYIVEMRQAARRWLARWWGLPAPPEVEEPVEILPEEALNCTETGQVGTALGGENPFTLNRRMARGMALKRPAIRDREGARLYQEDIWRRVVRVSQFRMPEGAPTGEVAEPIESPPLHAERIVYRSETDIAVPGLLFRPEGKGPHPGLVFVHGQGKEAASGWAARLAREGFAVLTIDFRGVGETAPPPERDGGHPYDAFLLGSQANTARSALYLGRSLFGMRVLDVIQGAAYLKGRGDVAGVGVVGTGAGALMALYAGALDEGVRCVVANRMLYAYRALTERLFHSHPFSVFLPGVLKEYDLGDVAGLVAPRPFLLINPVDELERPAEEEAVAAEYEVARTIYKTLGTPEGLSVARTWSEDETFRILGGWMREHHG